MDNKVLKILVLSLFVSAGSQSGNQAHAQTDGQVAAAASDTPVTLESDLQKEGYAMGASFGKAIDAQLANVPVEFDRELLVRGLMDVLSDQPVAMTDKEIETVLTAQRERVMKEAKEKADKTKAEGDAFLAEWEKQEGVQKTESGILYQVLEAGDGAQPQASDTVKVHYRGTLRDGSEFDSSYSRNVPAEFPVNGVIKGWQEALQLMKTGAKWKVAIPSDLAYGERGAGAQIGPNEPLVFEINLLEIK